MTLESKNQYQHPDLARMIDTIYNDLNWKQLAIFARQTPEQRIAMLFDLCNFALNLAIAGELQNYPNLSDDDLTRRVQARLKVDGADEIVSGFYNSTHRNP